MLLRQDLGTGAIRTLSATAAGGSLSIASRAATALLLSGQPPASAWCEHGQALLRSPAVIQQPQQAIEVLKALLAADACPPDTLADFAWQLAPLVPSGGNASQYLGPADLQWLLAAAGLVLRAESRVNPEARGRQPGSLLPPQLLTWADTCDKGSVQPVLSGLPAEAGARVLEGLRARAVELSLPGVRAGVVATGPIGSIPLVEVPIALQLAGVGPEDPQLDVAVVSSGGPAPRLLRAVLESLGYQQVLVCEPQQLQEASETAVAFAGLVERLAAGCTAGRRQRSR